MNDTFDYCKAGLQGLRLAHFQSLCHYLATGFALYFPHLLEDAFTFTSNVVVRWLGNNKISSTSPALFA